MPTVWVSISRLQRAVIPAPPDLSPHARIPLIDSLSAARQTAQSLTWKNSAGCFGSITVYSSLSWRKRGKFVLHLCLYVLHLNNRCPFSVLVGTHWHSLHLCVLYLGYQGTVLAALCPLLGKRRHTTNNEEVKSKVVFQ